MKLYSYRRTATPPFGVLATVPNTVAAKHYASTTDSSETLVKASLVTHVKSTKFVACQKEREMPDSVSKRKCATRSLQLDTTQSVLGIGPDWRKL